ncbi:uncharacterized protein K489DRAFT_385056 [Dissoconium aciculare CBS 342.82]|jgi:hypothetical protein|uniref:F-box domain-containing protein n=1 Tax=Dissoconium aciculare CBS 342.82 TaxID=1314786 RepID=A0A6J3LQY7_9PEZI|nr:uncharacterized protein K489DRAFT_385056 [Dissoconium aciculare CBS 342.82]KAF1818276.1 hypothetical protein K489DRAFT_385056 [Dissoconium aciculare CBS 342.82]
MTVAITQDLNFMFRSCPNLSSIRINLDPQNVHWDEDFPRPHHEQGIFHLPIHETPLSPQLKHLDLHGLLVDYSDTQNRLPAICATLEQLSIGVKMHHTDQTLPSIPQMIAHSSLLTSLQISFGWKLRPVLAHQDWSLIRLPNLQHSSFLYVDTSIQLMRQLLSYNDATLESVHFSSVDLTAGSWVEVYDILGRKKLNYLGMISCRYHRFSDERYMPLEWERRRVLCDHIDTHRQSGEYDKMVIWPARGGLDIHMGSPGSEPCYSEDPDDFLEGLHGNDLGDLSDYSLETDEDSLAAFME